MKTALKEDCFQTNLSGREDLNLRPLAPHASALAGLRHAPRQGRIIVSFYESGNEK